MPSPYLCAEPVERVLRLLEALGHVAEPLAKHLALHLQLAVVNDDMCGAGLQVCDQLGKHGVELAQLALVRVLFGGALRHGWRNEIL